MRRVTPQQIDQLLPQTQCELCGYPGCLPYAEAIVDEQAPINLCLPGGTKTLAALATLLQEDSTPYLADMALKTKPPILALIREAECIGCTKCIAACPVDAILGSGKQMHTVIAAECTGCELCVPACPVDCIDLVTTAAPSDEKKNYFRNRYQTRQQRLAEEKMEKERKKMANSIVMKKKYIAEARLRVKAKKQRSPMEFLPLKKGD